MPVPQFTYPELLNRLNLELDDPKLQDKLPKATLVYVFTSFSYHLDEESVLFLSRTRGNGPPLMKLVKEEEEEEGGAGEEEEEDGLKRVVLNAADRQFLNLEIFTLFGGSHEGEGLSHWAVAEIERLAHIKLWEHPKRAWRKCGGDPPQEREGDARRHRVACILLSTVPLPANFVWASDKVMKRGKECPQKLT